MRSLNQRRATGRLVGVDATRGLALLGMMAIHVLPDRDPDESVSTAYLIASGRSAATFAVLAGVGLALATDRMHARGDDPAQISAAVAVRGLMIGGIGLMLGYFNSGVAVILGYYALLFLLAVPLLRLFPPARGDGPDAGARVLAGLAAAVAVVVPVVSHMLRARLPSPSRANPTFDTLIRDPVGTFLELTLTGYYPVLAWLTYLCAGLAAGRLALRSASGAALLAGGGAAVAVAASLCSWVLLEPLGGRDQIAATVAGDLELSDSRHGTTPPTTWWWLAVDSPHASTPFDLLHTTGTALALLGVFLLVARVAGGALIPLAAAGSMTLSLYTGHVLLLSSPFLPTDPETSYVFQVIAALILATAWRITRRRGPMETFVAHIVNRARRPHLGPAP